MEALDAEGIRFCLIGMSAAIAQGVMGSTLDVDLWIDLPPRQYMKVQRIARSLGATVAANTVVYLEDGIPVNFVYEVTGLASFNQERRHMRVAHLHGSNVPVLALSRIRASKNAIRRDKDVLHIRLIDDFLKCKRAAERRPRPPAVPR